MARIDEVSYEYGLSKDQTITFDSYVAENFAGHIWLNSYEPGTSPNPKEWYDQMADEHLYAARVLRDLASSLWKIDLEAIYRELSQEERREIYIGV